MTTLDTKFRAEKAACQAVESFVGTRLLAPIQLRRRSARPYKQMRLQVIKHSKYGVGFVVETSTQLRRLWFSNNLHFWEVCPRSATRREGGNLRRIPRSRLHKSIWRITPEPYPGGYRTGELKSPWEGTCKMIRTLAINGYPKAALESLLSKPMLPTKPDRRQRRPCGSSDYPSDYSNHSIADPEHPYRPAALIVRIRSARGEQISEKKFAEVIVTMRGSQSAQSEGALWEICVVGRKVTEVAASRGLSVVALEKAAQRLRKKAQIINFPETICA